MADGLLYTIPTETQSITEEEEEGAKKKGKGKAKKKSSKEVVEEGEISAGKFEAQASAVHVVLPYVDDPEAGDGDGAQHHDGA